VSEEADTARRVTEAASQAPGLFPVVWAAISTLFIWLLKHTISSHAEAVKEMRQEMHDGFAESRRDREAMRAELFDVRSHVEHIRGRLDGHDSWERKRYERLGE